MRVLIVVGSEKVPTFIETLVQGLAGKGVQVGLYGKSLKSARWNNVHRILSDYSRFGVIKICFRILIASVRHPGLVLSAGKYVDDSPYWKVRVKNFYRIVAILQFAPDVIHIQWALHSRSFDKLITSGKFKIVVSLRGAQINITPFVDPSVDSLYQRLFPLVYFHAVSQDIKKKSLRWHTHEHRVKVIYSPVPERFLQAFDLSRTVAVNPLKVLSVGRFHWLKGYSYAIEAIKVLRDKGIPVHYTIVAQGEISGEILYQIHDRQLESCIEIVNGVSYDQIITVMQQHSVLLLPSIEEGIANVVLEAMAIGLPVITTACGGMEEAVENEVNGWVIPVRDVEATVAVLKKITSISSEDMYNIRRKAHDVIRNQFSQSNLESFKSWYEWVSAQR